MRGIERLDAVPIEIDLGAAVRGGNPLSNQCLDGAGDGVDIVFHQRINQPECLALLTAVNGPDQRPIALARRR